MNHGLWRFRVRVWAGFVLLMVPWAVASGATPQASPEDYQPPEKGTAVVAVRDNMMAALRAGAEIVSTVQVAGSKQKVRVTEIDDQGILLKPESGKTVLLTWSKLGGEDFALLARSAAQGNGAWLLALADYHLAGSDWARAEEVLAAAAQADPSPKEEVEKRSQYLTRMKSKPGSGKPGRGIQVKPVELARLPAEKVPPPAYAAAVGPGAQLVIPSSRVLGGTGVENNAKANPKGGYFSTLLSVGDFKYPDTHANQLGKTAMVNDHTYWDTSPGGLDSTHSGPPDPAGGSSLWWPVPTEWASYELDVSAQDTYTIMTRFSSSWGPSKAVVIHMTVDGASSGPITLKPDDPKIWSDTQYQVGGWWGHTMTNCTSPVGWTLPAGKHVLKVTVDSFPEKQTDHGNVWIHYFKVVKAGTPIGISAPPAPKRK